MTKRLPITLWSCCRTEDAEHLDRVVRVLNYCTKLFLFEHVVLFTFLEPTRKLPRFTEVVQIPPLDINQFNIFVNKIAPRWLTRYPHAMSVHEDGFILRPHMWADSFLDYDYIGAPWADGEVGNGGFSIESKRLLEFKMKELPFYERLKVPYDGRPFLPSDVYLCRIHRHFLKTMGFVFAPPMLASVFSREQLPGADPTFGFHGRNCQPALYAEGWQTIKESEVP
jgi:Protein of unknown function (DUF5672)